MKQSPDKQLPDCRNCIHCHRSGLDREYDRCERLTHLHHVAPPVYCAVERQLYMYLDACGPHGKYFVCRKTFWTRVKEALHAAAKISR